MIGLLESKPAAGALGTTPPQSARSFSESRAGRGKAETGSKAAPAMRGRPRLVHLKTGALIRGSDEQILHRGKAVAGCCVQNE
jgi:hypothetical protein